MDAISTPYAGTSANRLTALINEMNAASLVEGVDFVYEDLSILEEKPGFNTAITLMPKKSGMRPSIAHYTRLSLEVLSELPEQMLKRVVVATYPTSTHRILDKINFALGLNLTRREVIDIPYYSYQEKMPLKINGSTSSFAWLESEYLFEVVENGNLEHAISNKRLNGLYPPGQ